MGFFFSIPFDLSSITPLLCLKFDFMFVFCSVVLMFRSLVRFVHWLQVVMELETQVGLPRSWFLHQIGASFGTRLHVEKPCPWVLL